MTKATAMRDPEARAFLAMLPDESDRRNDGSAGTRHGASRKQRIRQKMGAMLAVYALTVAGASGVLFLVGVLLRRW